MKTPKFPLLAHAAMAASIALAGSFAAVPAMAGTAPAFSTADPAPLPAVDPAVDPSGEPGAPGISDGGLAAAVRRDLGMSMTEFNAAGVQGKRAADAVPSLRGIPGYVGISLAGGKIVVEGSGPVLQARVAELNEAGPADFEFASTTRQAPDSAAIPDSADAPPADALPAAAPPVDAPPVAALEAAAEAGPSAEMLAASTQQLFEDYVRDVGSPGLQAVVYADSGFIIRTGAANTTESGTPGVDLPKEAAAAGTAPAPGKISPADFVARYANVALEQGSPISTEEEDLFGGQGFITEGGAFCSAGFSGFDSAGAPLVLTAGHCAADGAAKRADVELPTDAPAGGGSGAGTRAGELGDFGFSQFGGPGNSRVADGGTNTGTDIAVLESIRTSLQLQPAVMRWDDPARPGPTAVKVVGTVAPFPGQPVCRSGRSLSWSCGTVDTVGIWIVGGPNNVPDGADLRALNGFDSTSVQSRPGDSGGPWISGNFAVGTHTGAEESGDTQIRAIATTLEDALLRIPGAVQLKLFLNEPVPDAPTGGTVTTGEPVTGHVPAGPASVVAPNSRVRITVEDHAPVEVPLDAAGNWSFPAPDAPGPLSYTMETVNGFSSSGTAAREVLVSDLTAPVITSPAEGWQVAGVDVIDGTGEPGRTVKVSGAVEGTATVADDGRWSISVADQPAYGHLTVTAVLSAAGHIDSPTVSRAFTALPPAPEVTSMPDGSVIGPDALLAGISGTGLDGAEVTVSVDGVIIGTASAGITSGTDPDGGGDSGDNDGVEVDGEVGNDAGADVDGDAGAEAGAAGGLNGVDAQGSVTLSVPQAQQASGASGSGAAGAVWSVPFPAGLTAGPHTVSVTQSVDGVASPPAVSAFVLDAAAVEVPVETPPAENPAAETPAAENPAAELPVAAAPAAETPAAETPAAAPSAAGQPVAGASPVAPASAVPSGSLDDAGPLSETGATGLIPAAFIGAGALLLGVLAVVFIRRRDSR